MGYNRLKSSKVKLEVHRSNLPELDMYPAFSSFFVGFLKRDTTGNLNLPLWRLP